MENSSVVVEQGKRKEMQRARGVRTWVTGIG